MSNAFYSTRDLFRNHINYTAPLSYEEWLATADDNKAAVLYVQFFDQITLAWYKVKSFYTLEEDAVSTVLQYLMKNVPIIEKDSKRFKASYIYRVAYNCLYCICHDYQTDKTRWEMECSNIVEVGDDVLDLFDTVPGDGTAENECFRKSESRQFWEVLENLDEDSQAVIDKLLNPDSPLPAHLRRNVARRNEIIEELKRTLAEFRTKYDY